MWYTIDGSDPTNAAPSFGPIGSGATLSLQFPAGATNLTFKVRAFRANYQTSAVISKSFIIANNFSITISPNAGYYPMGQTITVSGPIPTPPVYYTTDGSDPTTNSLPVAMSGNVGTIKWFNSTSDLRGLRVKAITPGGASYTAAGQPVAAF